MSSLVLKILLTLYILYALLKFFEFFFRSDEAKMRGLRSVYSGDNRVIKVFDNVILVLMLIFVGLLFVAGVEYLSFTTGLLVGMSIIQVYFHRFSDPLPPEKSPDPPITGAENDVVLHPSESGEGMEGTCVHDRALRLGTVHAGGARLRLLSLMRYENWRAG